MKRTGKRKNLKLRRQIRRTVAALFMIMAIVVAAIPVENLGTMKAASTQNPASELKLKVDFDALYGSANDVYSATTAYGDSTPSEQDFELGTKRLIQQLNGDRLYDIAEVWQAKNDRQGIIDQYIGASRTDLTINKSEYYDYIQIDKDYLTAVKNFFATEVYTAEFAVAADGNCSFTGDSTQNLASIQYKIFDPKSITYSQTGTEASGIVRYQNNKNDYIQIYGALTSDSIKAIFDNTTPALSNRVKDIDTENTTLKKYKTRLTTLQNNISNLTDAEKAEWNTIAEDITRYNNRNLQKLSITFEQIESRDTSDIAQDSDNDRLSDAYEYFITERLQNGVGKQIKDYDLVPINYITKDNIAENYLLKAKTKNNNTDDSGYLVQGEVEIKGIGSEAFAEKEIGGTISIKAEVAFVGKDAFKNMDLVEKIEINDRLCRIIGDRAFENCMNLEEVRFLAKSANQTSLLDTLGNFAFYGSAISKLGDVSGQSGVNIIKNINTIGAGCFAYAPNIESVSFSGEAANTVTIHDFAFFGCENLTSVKFPNKREYKLRYACFALDVDSDVNAKPRLSEFVYPAKNTSLLEDNLPLGSDPQIVNGKVLANRYINHVVFPENLKQKVPDSTFAGCINLGYVEFPDSAYLADYNPDKLFSDVENPSFYVKGPAKQGNLATFAVARETTWKATMNVFINGIQASVPYQYKDNTGWHFELGKADVSDPNKIDFIQSIDIKDEKKKEASLAKFEIKNSNPKPTLLVIQPVGQYTIVEISKDCLGEKAKEYVYEIDIPDGTVRKINDEAFSNCNNLQWVSIGNSVEEIGNNAFFNCPKLQNVEFSKNMITDWTTLKIADNAFHTQSELLTFHGNIHPDYAPYIIASNKNATTQNLLKSGNEICYKTDAPLNLTVIKDNAAGDNYGKMTLVDYPHYEDVNVINEDLINDKVEKLSLPAGTKYSITDRFEYFYHIVNSIPTYSAGDALDQDEFELIDQVLNMQLPDGVESIDTVSFFTKEANTKNQKYIDLYYIGAHDPDFGKIEQKTYALSGSDRIRKVNFITSLADKFKKLSNLYGSIKEDEAQNEVMPGLFSGYFKGDLVDVEAPSLLKGYHTVPVGASSYVYDGTEFVENDARGNDHLVSIDLGTVSALPDYAFDSNENLKYVDLGSKMEQIGALPFRNCKKIENINASESPKFIFEKGILYEVLEDNSLRIVECLENRTDSISKATDPLIERVSQLSDGCFSNCKELANVDFTGAKFLELPENAFTGCDGLSQVTLPSSILGIRKEAFSQIDKGRENNTVLVRIPNPICTLTEDMCKDSVGKFIIELVPEYQGNKSPCMSKFLDFQKKYPNSEWLPFDEVFQVKFVLLDNTEIATFNIPKGTDATAPSAPKKNGEKFVTWYCEVNGTFIWDEAAYTNINEPRTVFAIYKEDKYEFYDPQDRDWTLTMDKEYGSAYLMSDLERKPMQTITCKANTPIFLEYSNADYLFIDWIVTSKDGKTDYSYLAEDLPNNSGVHIASFTMPVDNVVVSAKKISYEDINNNNNNNNDNNNNNNNSNNSNNNNNNSGNNSSDTQKYKVTVNYGSGSGDYAAGETVTISAFAPESSTKVFSKWTTTNSGLGFADANKSTTTFTMPAAAVVVTANYKTRSASDEDDDTSASVNRRPVGNSSTVTVTQNPGTGTTNTTDDTNTKPQNQTTSESDKLYIDKNGVSNKDVGSADVTGSTDNFVVKISESAESAEAAKQALLNRYGSLDGIAYFPFDLSLYDATGKTKITDTYGLNVNVTMPIPDALIQYGGNAKVAAVEGGYLNELTPRFKSIDGIGCISYTPPHFSPYVVYVDTNNLIASTSMDATPQTGDPIHPKWFLATGMACLSILLFVTGDRKRKVKLA